MNENNKQPFVRTSNLRALHQIASFGIGQAGKRTGIIFNSGMNDFSAPSLQNLAGLPAQPGNYIAPQKRPQSSMSPSIVTDKNGKVRLVIGAAGGTKIPTSILMVCLIFQFSSIQLAFKANNKNNRKK